MEKPELFDAVVSDGPVSGGSARRVREIQVKQAGASSRWIWGAFKMRGATMRELHELWLERDRGDPYIGTLVNAWMARGGSALAVHSGESYVDVGTLGGYRDAIKLLSERPGGTT